MPVSVSLRRGAFSLAFATALVAGLSTAVHADNLDVSGDVLENKSAVALGTVCRGEGGTAGVTFGLVRNGGTSSPQVWGNSAVVSIAPGAVAGNAAGSLVLGSTTATTLPGWTGADNNTRVASGVASVVLSVPADAPVGAASASATYSATGPGASATSVTRTDPVTFTWTVEDCAPADTSAPEISYVLDPATPDGDNGWYVSDVSIDWTVTDPESDVTATVGCVDETFGADGTFAPQCSATSAGGTAGPVTVSIERDATAPEVAFTGGPADGSSYWFGDPIPEPSTCSASDETSKVTAAGCSVAGGGTAVGTYEQIASASDNAGNSTMITRSYEIKAWTLDGFYKPVTMGTSVANTVKAGSTVPLKFNVLKGSTPMTSDIGASFSARKVGCDGSDVLNAVEEFVTTGSTSLRYDAAGGQWVQNWATPSGGKGSCYRVTMTTADGSAISADFKLK